MKQKGPLHTGISSLLLIFLVLSLVSFAVLTLAQSLAEIRRTKRYAERTRNYYEACLTAEQQMAAAAAGEFIADYPFSDTQYLHVEALLSEETDAPAISVWQVQTYESAYQMDERLPVLP